MGQHVDIETEEELAKIKKTIENAGYYWTHQSREEFEQTKADPAKIDALFKSLVYARVQEWLDLADERLAGKSAQMYMSPGNDDWFVIDEMIDAAKLIKPCDMRNVDLDGHEMITCSWSNPTPWQTPRELPEEELEAKLEALCADSQEQRDGDLQLPRAAPRLLARPLPEALRGPHHVGRGEDPRRQPRRQEDDREIPAAAWASSATSTRAAAPRRPAAPC